MSKLWKPSDTVFKPVETADRLNKMTDDIASATELPEVTSDNNGNILTVVEGAWAAAAAPTELPAVTGSNNGNVLTVVEGAWAAAAAPAELPAVTGSNNGNVLTVVEGAWAAAAAPSGASSVMLVNKSSGVLDKTWQEIHNAISSGMIIVILESGLTDIREEIVVVVGENDGYDKHYLTSLKYQGSVSSQEYNCDSADGYPEVKLQ